MFQCCLCSIWLPLSVCDNNIRTVHCIKLQTDVSIINKQECLSFAGIQLLVSTKNFKEDITLNLNKLKFTYSIKNNHVRVNEITNHPETRLHYLYIALMGVVIIPTQKNKKNILYTFPGRFYPAAQLRIFELLCKADWWAMS